MAGWFCSIAIVICCSVNSEPAGFDCLQRSFESGLLSISSSLNGFSNSLTDFASDWISTSFESICRASFRKVSPVIKF